MKKLLLTICTFFCLFANAQLDTEHWFAPMSAKAGINGLEGYLYLSTDETTPFPVQIYNNNTLYTTVQVSKGNPQQVIIPNQFLITATQSQLFTQNNMGLNVKGTKKFFANYRFALPNHAEILTSKGAAGLGTTFFAGVAPISGSEDHMSSTIGVTATEDNTTVTISGYNPAITFSDGVSAPSRTFTLNKGKSYILDVVSSWSNANRTGLVGAKIVATKPISVTNGNFNAAYTSLNLTNNDVLMDQAVPIDRLGKDFVVVKGNGTVTSQMETALIIATENNTQISFNGAATTTTLNTGQYYLVPSNRYINQGNGHYNMNISASKNIYVYQLLSGATNGNEYASGGMNFIPPLSCFMPNKIEEIGYINRIGGQTFATRLNIITQSGATVTLNGNPIAAANGPFPVTGNSNWVSYSIQNVTGNVTVNSTKAMTAGIAAGSGAVGYGGYFAGFSSVPAITKTGDCYTGVLLQVDNNYDAYQWYFNGNPIPGATSNSINPELYGAGDYTCSITKNNCETRLTAVYNYTLCPPVSTTTYTIGSCNTKVITPAFTNSTQTIIPSLTSIIVQPTSGTVAINPTTGQITYTPNAGITTNTSDTFTYYIQGNGNPFAFEYFKINLNIDVLQVNNASLASCATTNGNGTFNLTSANISTDTGITIAYYTNANLTGQITNPTNYSGPAGIIYANVTSQYGCSKVAQVNLTVNPLPNVNNASLASCVTTNGNGTFNLTSANISTDTGITITYYTDANLTGQITNPANYSGPAGIIYANVTSQYGCSKVAQINLTVNPLPNVNNVSLASCVTTNGNGTFNLTSANISTDTGITITYYTNANLTGQIANPTTYTGPAGIIYANVTSAYGCSKVAQITLTTNPSPNINTNNFNANICDENFDGIVAVNFANVTPQIVTNPANFNVRYYLSQADANAGNNNTIPVNWNYNTNTTVYVRVDALTGDCPTVFGQINFTIENKITLLTSTANTDICDNDLNGSESVNLNDYKALFTTDPNVTLTFYTSLANAQNATNAIPATQVINTHTTYFIRFTSPNSCPNTGTLNLIFKSPRKSTTLHDQVICSDEHVLLDAGAGFTTYKWSTGATTQTITVGAGNYYVDLGLDGCVYRQYVNVITAQAPIITKIDVVGTTATIHVTGGTPPYRYSLNGIDYQDSNIFIGLSRGTHKVYVLGSDGCLPVTKEFLVLNIVNAITPNGDGINDVLNYSDLRIKENVSIEVADRYGATVYKSANKNYIWDGKPGGRTLPTGTYWYVIKWTEPDTKLPVSYSGWILIKNRE
ncbi:gliding motility-associated C-terminal domain-containing protein [Chryseobacterium oryctis]|uniref:Gliding motility-associated C-terminal domain-containing protein n=1 Tax=Chryseobacterium oryctis TaxID=2952618 RepID=A0ABT3HKK1_9FLAO|nr:gliding motility-associated C-terminal domain-containing protein [Chryseobacterium oryctis]MCW3160323.1 gliding motility-associated C-terminal domain-containing protein [Chryseobacterium oryctis]